MGYNWRMSEPHAIIGLRHLEAVAGDVATGSASRPSTDEGLRGLAGLRPLTAPGWASATTTSTWPCFRAPDRAALKRELKERSPSRSRESLEAPLHAQPVFADYATAPLPVADDLCARHVCLPHLLGWRSATPSAFLGALRATIG